MLTFAQVEEVRGDEVYVRYVDYGNAELLPRNRLRSVRRDVT
jgi:hypothetical protein